MENLVVGQRVILNREMLGEHIGSIGYVYEEYNDFDGSENNAVSVIFMNGGFDGFSVREQELFLIPLEVDSRYTMYEFKNVNQVYKDYQNGYWQFWRAF